MNVLALPQTWDDVSAGYAALTMASLRPYARDAVARAGLQPGWKALDVACGPGTLSELLTPRVASVTGVDFAENEAKRYSYERRYHPVVRLQDGTLWNY